MPDRKSISDDSQKIAKDWFDAAINRGITAPSSPIGNGEKKPPVEPTSEKKNPNDME